MTNKSDKAKIAKQFVECFEEQPRKNSQEKFIYLKTNAPKWVKNAVRELCGKFPPDNWRYKIIQNVANCLVELEGEWNAKDIDDILYQVVSSDLKELCDWVTSCYNRERYVSERLGAKGYSALWQLLASAQAKEYEEVAYVLMDILEEKAGSQNSQE